MTQNAVEFFIPCRPTSCSVVQRINIVGYLAAKQTKISFSIDELFLSAHWHDDVHEVS